MTQGKSKGGRPTKYRRSVARGICIRLMLGESLNSICKRPGYPSKVTVFAWLARYPELLNQYRYAREIQLKHHQDEMLQNVDDGSNDWMERTSRDGDCIGYSVNGEAVQRSRPRVATRKWIMERMAPKTYGAKQSVDLTCSD